MEFKCKYCGASIPRSTRGKQATTCKSEECRKKARKEAVDKYLAKKKEERKAAKKQVTTRVIKAQVIQDTPKQEEANPNKIVCERPLKQGHGYMVEYARKFGALVYELIEELKEAREKVQYYDQLEEDLIHTLENMELLKEKDAIQMAITLKKSRNERRFYKDKVFLLQSFLDKILIKEPEKFVRTGIDMINNSKYTYKVMEDKLKESFNTETQDQEQPS